METQIIYILYAAVFFYLAYCDYKTQRIPNRIILPAMVIVTLLNCFLMPIGWQNTLIGGGIGLGAAIMFYVLGVRSGGDLKLIVLIGLTTGYPLAYFVIPGLTILTGIVGLILKVIHKKKWSDKIPYGTYIGSGAAIVILVWSYLYGR